MNYRLGFRPQKVDSNMVCQEQDNRDKEEL